MYFGSKDVQVGMAIDTILAYTILATGECTSCGSSASAYDFKTSTTAVYNSNVKENLEIQEAYGNNLVEGFQIYDSLCLKAGSVDCI